MYIFIWYVRCVVDVCVTVCGVVDVYISMVW